MGDPSRIGIYSEAADNSGQDRLPLAVLGRVSGIVPSSTYPGGDDALTFNLEADPLLQHRALTIGRRIRASLCGHTIWSGKITTPAPGQPWQISCTGIGSIANQYTVDTGPGVTTDANIFAKIAEGLPWIHGNSWPTLVQPLVLGQQPLGDFLNAQLPLYGEQWSVASDGLLTHGQPPASPRLILVSSMRPARTTENYVTLLAVLYIDSGTLAISKVTVTAPTTHGQIEDVADLTALGPMSSTDATTYGNGLLARCGFRGRYAEAFTVQAGQLLSYPGGVPVDLATVRAGVMVRPTGVNPDQMAETTLGVAACDFVVGTSSYDDDTGVLSLTPYEDATASADLQSLVADLTKQAA